MIDGHPRSMMSCPDFPVGSFGIVEVENPGRGVWYSTACWREYVGTWVLDNGRLFLWRLEGKYRLQNPDPLFASWYSGTLVVPDGRLVHYVHMGFGSIYEREIHITVANGLVTHTEVVDNRARLEALRP
ncbi:hypothetical protein [Pseudoxanthomonas suwonensis]|nr:hypothetical protein [Pseudoxanthomonas suwonensis]